MTSIKEHPPLHVPVLLSSTLEQLDPQPGEVYLDLTAGYGGHARVMLERTHNYTDAVLVDRDKLAIDSLTEFSQQGATLRNDTFVDAARALIAAGQTFDIILADLGVSSPQLDRAERGFSFRFEGPLDMRMDPRQKRTAADIVNTYKKDELVQLIYRYGEETMGRARRIAEAIITARPIHTTAELARSIEQALGRGGLKQHPATRTFQALRIEVNQELRLIAELMPLLPRLLRPGGRVGIISFHSLEDRLVKRYFKEQAEAGYEAELQLQTKKPIDGATYDVHNPRSRSAKLRVAVKK